MAVPYTFGSATTSIPLSQLDSNFATTITLGNTAIQLGNTVTTLNNMTLANVTVSSASTPVPEAAGGTGTTTGYYGFKNRIINGAMVIDQRNAGASVTPTQASYPIDRWRAYISQTSKFTTQQTTTAPVGFNNSLLITSSSSYPVGASEFFSIQQFIEGYNIADLGWGTANAKTVTLSFQVYSSLTGTFGGAIQNDPQNRSYPFTYTISSANTWTTISITIAGDTTGTWLTTNGRGIAVWFSLGAGSSVSGTAGSWAGAAYYSATGAVSVVGTNAATWYITGVQLEKGSTATSFDYRPYGTDLSLCQRYFQTSNGASIPTNFNGGYVGFVYTNGVDTYGATSFKVTMRTTPTVTLYDNVGASGVATQTGVANGIAAIADRISPNGFSDIYKSSGSWSQTSSQYPIAAGYTASAEL
jgi:hypothetical protein